MERILTYVYYKWDCTVPMGIIGMQADRFITNFHKMANCGLLNYVTYAGRMNCTCGGTERFGQHYGFIIQADKEMTRKILGLIDADITESFDEETMEKLDKSLNGFDEWYWEVRAQQALKLAQKVLDMFGNSNEVSMA